MTNVMLHAGERSALIPADRAVLRGTLAWPTHPSGVVIFAHGSDSSRLSPRNQHVAERLRQAGMATLLFDLLTSAEAADRANVFDVPLLAKRLIAGAKWVAAQPEVGHLPLGLFGASTGAAAALVAAGASPEAFAAVVSRGGRPDLAGPALPKVKAPTLLLVGSRDDRVLDLNRQALARMQCQCELQVIPGATHLFEEPGTLDNVARWAANWFVRHLSMEKTWERCSCQVPAAKQ